ncbi:MAG: hypothetical protein ACLRSJ_07465, partial [Agathobaculum sp.]
IKPKPVCQELFSNSFSFGLPAGRSSEAALLVYYPTLTLSTAFFSFFKNFPLGPDASFEPPLCT